MAKLLEYKKKDKKNKKSKSYNIDRIIRRDKKKLWPILLMLLKLAQKTNTPILYIVTVIKKATI